MIDCRDLELSQAAGTERLEKAEEALGKSVVTKMLALALYWLGGRRPRIASELGIPENSLRTTVRAVLSGGLAALEDRRRRCSSAFLPPPAPAPTPPAPVFTAVREHGGVRICLGRPDVVLNVPAANRLQARVVVLSLVDSGLIRTAQAADVLELSAVHVRNLAAALAAGDVEALLDRRRGRREAHVLTSDVKSEIVLQYAANAVTGRSTSSAEVAADLADRSGLQVSDRTLRHCIEGLGLGRIATELPRLVERLKRGSGP